MSNVGYATISVIPSFQGFQSRLSAGVAAPLAQAGRDGGRKFGDSASREAGERFKRGWAERLRGFAPFAGMAIGGAALFAPLVKGFGRLTAIEDAQAKLRGLGHDAASVKQIMDDALASVKGTAYGLDEAASVAASTVAAGIKPGQDLERILKLIADAATIGGSSIGEMGAIFNKVAAANKIQGDVINQLNDQGIPILQMLGKQLKMDAAEVSKMASAGKVDFATFAAAMEDGLGGAALKSGETLKGAFKNTQAALSRVGANLLSDVYPQVQQFFTATIGGLEDVEGAAKVAGKVIGDSLGAATDVVGKMPPEAKAAAAAFVALRIAAATGVTSAAASSMSAMSSAMVGLRIRTMLAADAFTAARTTSIAFNGNVGTVSRGVGRLSASMAGLRAGAVGAGSALRSGLGGAMSLLGGPWGIAILGATAAVTHFWQENQKAKQRIDDMTTSLDEQTGALTKNSRETAFKALQDSGAIDAARKLGLNLADVTSAALGNEQAMSRVRSQLEEYSWSQTAMSADSVIAIKNWIGVVSDQERATAKVREAIGQQNGELAQSKQDWRDHAEAMGDSADAANGAAGANQDTADSFASLRDRMREARDEVDRLAAAEQRRRLANLKNRRDRLALVEQMQATAAEATNGKEVGDIRSQIAEARKRGAEERRGLRQRMADIDPKSKTAARDRADLSRQIAESSRDEAKSVSDLQSKLSEYTRTLNINTKAGQENLSSLYDLADQWNNSSAKVRNAKGMYDQIRQSFIESAVQMGASKKRAKELADQLLLLPKERKTEIKTPGLKEALEDLAKLQERLKSTRALAIYVNTHQANDPRLNNLPRFAGGGRVGGYGIGDKQLILADSREWVINPRASAYYGDDFMAALNKMMLPRFAEGGRVGTVAPAPASVGGVSVGSQHFYGVDYRQWKRDQEHDMRAAAMGAVDFRG